MPLVTRTSRPCQLAAQPCHSSSATAAAALPAGVLDHCCGPCLFFFFFCFVRKDLNSLFNPPSSSVAVCKFVFFFLSFFLSFFLVFLLLPFLLLLLLLLLPLLRHRRRVVPFENASPFARRLHQSCCSPVSLPRAQTSKPWRQRQRQKTATGTQSRAHFSSAAALYRFFNHHHHRHPRR